MATQKAGHGLHQESHAGGAARASGGRGLDFLHDARRKMSKLLTVSLLLVLLTCGMAAGVSSNSPPANDVSFNLDRGHRLTVGSFSVGYLEVTERFVSKPTKLSTLVYVGGFQFKVPVPVTTFQFSSLFRIGC